MFELACKDAVFHFNKKHLEDPKIPMWVLKAKGESYYVNHVTCEIPWSTKETPENSHTKGSIKIKDCLIEINDDNEAKISRLQPHDIIRIRNNEKGITRVMWNLLRFEKVLKEENIKHSPFKRIYGACGTSYSVCDLIDRNQTILLSLKYPNLFRIVKPNESYYKAYDDPKLWKELQDKEYLDEFDDED